MMKFQTDSAVQYVWHYVAGYKAYFTAAMLAAVLSVTTSLLGPFYIGRTVDVMSGAAQVDFSRIAAFVQILLLVYLSNSLFTWLLMYFTNEISYGTAKRLRVALFTKLNKLPLSFFDKNAHGDIISRFVNDIDTISDGMVQGIANLLSGIVMILGALSFMIAISGKMTVMVLLSACMTYWIARFITQKTQQLFRKQATCLGQLNGYAEEQITGQSIVKAFSYEAHSFSTFSKLNQTLYETGVRAQFFGSLTNPTTRLVNNVTYGILGVTGSILTILGQITIGDIASFLIYATLFGKPFNDITSVFTQLQSAMASAQRIASILAREEETDLEQIASPVKTAGVVCFEHVSFAYMPEHPLLEDFSLSVASGKRIAIVGHTGAGKTTLVNLLMRFYEIQQGCIRLDGQDIRHMPRETLRQNFGMILQDTWLFAGTIRENIAYGKPNATDEEIIDAAKAADAHSFIRKMPHGYDTKITDAGENLSQGQRQLLTIARVMLTAPPLLILDEATSSIDTRTEQRIQQAFQKMMQGRTSFIIAHRLSTIQNADDILVMEQGHIVEHGTHKQLLAKHGAYEKLYASQFANADR